MEINKDYVINLMRKYNWSQADLARAMGVTPATVSRVLSGKRGTGKEVIAGLLKAFPNARLDELFFFEMVSPNDDDKEQTA